MYRIYLTLVMFAAVVCGCHDNRINRMEVVCRNNPSVTSFDTLSSFTVGNGHFAYTVDATGLQTFDSYYSNGVSLGTMSDWGWHSYANVDSFRHEETLVDVELFGRTAPYSSEVNTPGRQFDAIKYYRQNPHRLHLGMLGFELVNNQTTATIDDFSDIHQTLDMWNGVVNSSFKLWNEDCSVSTVCSSSADEVNVDVKSNLLSTGRMAFSLRLPYPSGRHTDDGCDWEHSKSHTSYIVKSEPNSATIQHVIDSTSYYIRLQWNGSARVVSTLPHKYVVVPELGSTEFQLRCLFTRDINDTGADDILAESSNWWHDYWNKGGFVDFGQCSDSRAAEIERRVVLSQYLCAVNCAGNMPPQETGLTFNSWFGRPHLEMFWWHGLDFALWNHPEMLERSFSWYRSAFPDAIKIANRQGYKGARWMKMTDPWAGEAPSKVGSFLIWQQPHVIYLAEELYRANPSEEVLNKYADLVEATAEFMASFATMNDETGMYELRGVIPAQETLKASETFNPPFELSYWQYGLRTAQIWRERMGAERNIVWDEMLLKLSLLPQKDGLYLAAQSAEDSYTNVKCFSDHPSVLGAFGVLPAPQGLDTTVMTSTFNWVIDNWNWDKTWGWDYPMTAMCAARLGNREAAVDALLKNCRTNTYLNNGHNYQDGRLRVYLPGNGGLLTAVAMMCAGWDGCTVSNPGFPESWDVRWEDLKPMQ